MIRRLPAIAIAVLLASTAAAQEPQLDPIAKEAQALFLAGREAVKRGDLLIAQEKFLRSLELSPTQGTLLNLAAVDEQLGKLVNALECFELAKKRLLETDDRYPVARDGAARVRARIPTLRVDFAAGSPVLMGARIDGAPLAVSNIGADVPMDPGTYKIATSAPGRAERSYEVTLKEGAKITLTVEAGARLVEAAPPAPVAPHPTYMQAAGLAAGGVGVAGLVIGTVTGVLAIKKKSDAASLCPDPNHCQGAGLDASGSGHALAGVSTASFVVGAAGVATGVVLYVLGREKPQAPRAAIAPWVLPGGGGFGASGRF
jgi:hypothetical protein